MQINNQSFTNLMNDSQPLINMSDQYEEYHLHSNNSNSSVHLIHMSADCINPNTENYSIDILVEEAANYKTNTEITDIVLGSDLPYLSLNTLNNTHIRLKQTTQSAASQEIDSDHTYRSKIQNNSTQMILSKIVASSTHGPETVLVTDQFFAPKDTFFKFTPPNGLTQPYLTMDMVSTNSPNRYNIVRVSTTTIYAIWNGSGSKPGFNDTKKFCIKNTFTGEMIYGVYNVEAEARTGYVYNIQYTWNSNTNQYDTGYDSSDLVSCDMFTVLGNTNQISMPGQTSWTDNSGIEYMARDDITAPSDQTPYTNSPATWTKYEMIPFLDDGFPRIDHNMVDTVMSCGSINANLVNMNLGDPSEIVESPIVVIYNKQTGMPQAAGQEEIKIRKYIPYDSSYPQTALALFESAFKGKLIVERGYANTVKNPSNYSAYDGGVELLLYLHYQQDYLFQIERNYDKNQNLNKSVWTMADTKVTIKNRTKKAFATLPVKGHAKGSSRIFQNMAVGPGVKLYGKLKSTSAFQTTISGYVINVSQE